MAQPPEDRATCIYLEDRSGKAKSTLKALPSSKCSVIEEVSHRVTIQHESLPLVCITGCSSVSSVTYE